MIQECYNMEKLDTGHFGYKAFIALSFNFPDLFIYLFIYLFWTHV